MSEETQIVTQSYESTRDRKWFEGFLAALREIPVVTHACQAVGIARKTAYENRDTNPEFAAAWDDAIEAGWDRAEKEAVRRAVEGYAEPIYGKDGVPVGERRIYSDRLLEVLLKGNRAKTYRETHTHELVGKNGGAIQLEKINGLSDEELTALVAQGIAAATTQDSSGQGGGGTLAPEEGKD